MKKGTMSPAKKSGLLFEAFQQKYGFYIPESYKNLFAKPELDIFLLARYNFFENFDTEIKIAAYNSAGPSGRLDSISVLEILMPDSPFIVDTIVDYCKANKYDVRIILHPIFNVLRSKGKLKEVNFFDASGVAESYVYLEINRMAEKDLKALKKNIETNLRELRRVVTDYPQMIQRLAKISFANTRFIEELEWLRENFVLLGLSSLKGQIFSGKHYGLLKKAGVRGRLGQELKLVARPNDGECLRYHETEIRSNVNKNRQIYIVLAQDLEQTLILVGHFRHRAEIELRNSIPSIRRMLEKMASELKVPETSYMRKELYKTAQALPVGFLLTRSHKFLLPWFVKVVSNLYTNEVSYHLSIDRTYDLVWAEIILPISESEQILGRPLRHFLKERRISLLHRFKYDLNQIQIFFLGFRAQEGTSQALKALLQQNAHELFSTWSSRFRELVCKKFSGDPLLNQKLERFFRGLSPDYNVHQEPEEVLLDLDTLENLKPEDGFYVYYYHQKSSNLDLIKVYTNVQTDLSELVPILTHFGFTIRRQYAFPYTPDESVKYTYVFSVPPEQHLKPADRVRISKSIAGVLNKRMTSRPVNELVRVAGLTPKQLRLMKAFCTYYYKISTSFTYFSIQTTVVKYPAFTKKLVDLFEAKFDPGSSAKDITLALQSVENSFRELDSVVDENICKALLSVVLAVVRTNYFFDRSEISFKINSRLIDNIPHPVPYFEIYVYSNDMEAVHLRGGPIARGGIRWSDRQDDYRTEILGLMKAQMVKNTVIVPVGSKGGFVLKNQTFKNRQEFLKAGQNAYRRFIRCLLEITDNLSTDGKVIPAKNIKRHDSDDPYLVVAADKGTATFSDLANEISREHKFWLTDAFASGGSMGYDHKKQGITAKSAWEAVKRHFHEMGINPEKENITAAGMGDMSGDVFGNGMLISKSLKLVAAFNHLYIFLDPNPDPKTAFKERERLFKKGGNWDEYNRGLISEGGGIFERNSRRIEISPEARTTLGIKSKTLSGEDLIKAVLRAPVDLLWNGGIGTYIKASHETHYQAGDPANDRVRIEAAQVRAKVVAEGGNLGLTQPARIEAANTGVRLNTDAIDNSGGVNMSDHEVNLKILLDNLCSKKIISYEERNAIIRKYDMEEIKLVLAQNYKINLGLSLDMRRVSLQFVYFRTLIKFLNQQGLINREYDHIPYESDLDNVEHADRILSRPVLCSLLGFAKLYGAKAFLASTDFDDPWFDRFIMRYFPQEISRQYAAEIKAHPLKKEIIITEILNEIVNYAGIAFFQRMFMATGSSVSEIAVTYIQLKEFLNLDKLRHLIEVGEDWLHCDIHYEYLLLLQEKVYRITKKIIKNKSLYDFIKNNNITTFGRMLKEASQHSSYRLPRKLTALRKFFSDAHADKILDAFKQIDVLEDTFNIFVNNRYSKEKWRVEDYFEVIQQYRIRELSAIVKDIRATSNWEIRFFSKVDFTIETLIGHLIKLKTTEKDTRAFAKKQRVKSLVNHITELHSRSQLSIASLYEMLTFLNEQMVTDSGK